MDIGDTNIYSFKILHFTTNFVILRFCYIIHVCMFMFIMMPIIVDAADDVVAVGADIYSDLVSLTFDWMCFTLMFRGGCGRGVIRSTRF